MICSNVSLDKTYFHSCSLYLYLCYMCFERPVKVAYRITQAPHPSCLDRTGAFNRTWLAVQTLLLCSTTKGRVINNRLNRIAGHQILQKKEYVRSFKENDKK